MHFCASIRSLVCFTRALVASTRSPVRFHSFTRTFPLVHSNVSSRRFVHFPLVQPYRNMAGWQPVYASFELPCCPCCPVFAQWTSGARVTRSLVRFASDTRSLIHPPTRTPTPPLVHHSFTRTPCTRSKWRHDLGNHRLHPLRSRKVLRKLDECLPAVHALNPVVNVQQTPPPPRAPPRHGGCNAHARLHFAVPPPPPATSVPPDLKYGQGAQK